MLIFCGIVVDASRLFAAKTIISGAGDLAMNAALSRYDKKLKDGYGLLAMASSPESEETTSELEKYFMLLLLVGYQLVKLVKMEKEYTKKR